MLEVPDKGNINWLLKKRDIASSYNMEFEEASRKRKGQDFLANDELAYRSEAKLFIDSSLDLKRRRFSEDSTNMNNNIKEGCYDHHMSLDLELNLSPSLIDLNHYHGRLSSYNKNYEEEERKKMMETGLVLGLRTQKSMARVAFDLDDNCCDHNGGGGGREEEMVARVCIKCHILVMLCKASPACPNCKFMHSREDTSLSVLFTPKPSTLLAQSLF